MTTTTSLQPITVEEKELRELADSYKSLVVTPETISEVDKARKVLKNKRLEIENTVKSNKKSIKDLIDKHVMEAERLVGIISPIEQRLLKEQKELEERQAAEARAKIEAEENRKRNIRRMISQIESVTSDVRKTTKIEDLQNIDFAMDEAIKDFDFQEFKEEADSVIEAFTVSFKARFAFLKEQEKQPITAEVVEEPIREMPDLKAGDNPRISNLIKLGFKSEPHGWVRDGEVIPNALLNIAEDAWQALLKNKVKVSAPQKQEPQVHETPVTNNHEMEIFTIQSYQFGFSKNIPFNKARQIRKAVEEILSA